MTREEAIVILENEAEYLYEDDMPYNREAFKMAVDALKSEPIVHCEDCKYYITPVIYDIDGCVCGYWGVSGVPTSPDDFCSRGEIINEVEND